MDAVFYLRDVMRLFRGKSQEEVREISRWGSDVEHLCQDLLGGLQLPGLAAYSQFGLDLSAWTHASTTTSRVCLLRRLRSCILALAFAQSLAGAALFVDAEHPVGQFGHLLQVRVKRGNLGGMRASLVKSASRCHVLASSALLNSAD